MLCRFLTINRQTYGTPHSFYLGELLSRSEQIATKYAKEPFLRALTGLTFYTQIKLFQVDTGAVQPAYHSSGKWSCIQHTPCGTSQCLECNYHSRTTRRSLPRNKMLQLKSIFHDSLLFHEIIISNIDTSEFSLNGTGLRWIQRIQGFGSITEAFLSLNSEKTFRENSNNSLFCSL